MGSELTALSWARSSTSPRSALVLPALLGTALVPHQIGLFATLRNKIITHEVKIIQDTEH